MLPLPRSIRRFPLLAAAAALAAVLSAAPAPASAQGQGPSPATASLGSQGDMSNFEMLQRSPVAFWKGMSQSEYLARTADKASQRVLQLGEYEFKSKNVVFDAQGNLLSLSLELRNDDPILIERAFDAYVRALGAIVADDEKGASGTEAVPDLHFRLLTWRGDDGSESALARLHSYTAKKKNPEAIAAGFVSFVVRN